MCVNTIVALKVLDEDGNLKVGFRFKRKTILMFAIIISYIIIQPAGPSGPRAESARAVTGRWCPHSGRGEDFLSRQPDFFTETALTPDRKVEKSFPRWEINRHVEG